MRLRNTTLTFLALACLAFPSHARSATGSITLNGSILTIMPCSFTNSLAEKYYSICVYAMIGYRDANGQFQTKPFRECRWVEAEALMGPGFSFTFLVDIPEATEIVGISANGSVEVMTAYGIHGWFTFVYAGYTSGASSTVTITTSRAGQCVAKPGLTSTFLDENGGIQPGTTLPEPPPPPSGPIVSPMPPPPIPTAHCSCQVNCIGNFNPTWVDLYGLDPSQCSHTNLSMQAAEAATCPYWGVGTKGACNWVAAIAPTTPAAVAASGASTAHCSCRIRCAYDINTTWVDMYGVNASQCNHSDPTMATAERQTCGRYSIASQLECNFVP